MAHSLISIRGKLLLGDLQAPTQVMRLALCSQPTLPLLCTKMLRASVCCLQYCLMYSRLPQNQWQQPALQTCPSKDSFSG